MHVTLLKVFDQDRVVRLRRMYCYFTLPSVQTPLAGVFRTSTHTHPNPALGIHTHYMPLSQADIVARLLKVDPAIEDRATNSGDTRKPPPPLPQTKIPLSSYTASTAQVHGARRPLSESFLSLFSVRTPRGRPHSSILALFF